MTFVQVAIVALFAALVTAQADTYSSYGGQESLRYKAPAHIPIVRYIGNLRGHGHYDFEHEGADGTIVSETGSMTHVDGAKEASNVKTGSVSWTSPEGIPFTYSYVADHTGFKPVGAHFPTPPPTPEAILNMLPFLPKLKEEEAEYQHQDSYSSYSAPSFSPSSFSAPSVSSSSYSAPSVSTHNVPAPTVVSFSSSSLPHAAPAPFESHSSYGSYSAQASPNIPPAVQPQPSFPGAVSSPSFSSHESQSSVGPPPAPLSTVVETSGYRIDSNPSNTKIRIGQ